MRRLHVGAVTPLGGRGSALHGSFLPASRAAWVCRKAQGASTGGREIHHSREFIFSIQSLEEKLGDLVEVLIAMISKMGVLPSPSHKTLGTVAWVLPSETLAHQLLLP